MPERKFALVLVAFLLYVSCTQALARDELVVSVSPFIDALNRSPTTVLFARQMISASDVQAIPGIVADCLSHVDGLKISDRTIEATYKITLSTTSFRAQFLTVAQAVDMHGKLIAVQADLIYPEMLKKKLCADIVTPLAEKLLHPPAETPESAASLQAVVEGIGYVNSGFNETAYVRFYKVLMDHPREADALYWLAEALDHDHPEIARLHAREFIAAFPDDSRRSKIETLLADQSGQSR